jgi:hypothetical protein
VTADSCLAAAGCLDPILGNIEAEKRHFHQENKLLNRWLSCKFLEPYVLRRWVQMYCGYIKLILGCNSPYSPKA